jgi:uncharacterized membrane protein YciS (DUF1049 family)
LASSSLVTSSSISVLRSAKNFLSVAPPVVIYAITYTTARDYRLACEEATLFIRGITLSPLLFAEFLLRFHLLRLGRFIHISMNGSIQVQYACRHIFLWSLVTRQVINGLRIW